jgi:hypothetical protein
MLVIAPSDDLLARVLDTIDGRLPSLAEHPARVALRGEPGPMGCEPAGLFLVE